MSQSWYAQQCNAQMEVSWHFVVTTALAAVTQMAMKCVVCLCLAPLQSTTYHTHCAVGTRAACMLQDFKRLKSAADDVTILVPYRGPPVLHIQRA